jgi:hypothetical protein
MTRVLMVWAGVMLAMLAAASPAAAQSRGQQGSQGGQVPSIKGEVRWWFPMEWDGEFGASNDGLGFQKIHAQSDLDVDDEVSLADFRVSVGDIQVGWLEFAHFSSHMKGEEFLDHAVTYEGINFPAGTYVETSWDFTYSALVMGQLYGMGSGYYLGYEIGAAEYRWRGRLRAPLDGLYAAVSEDPTVPLVGIQIAVGLGSSFRAVGVVRGNFLELSGSDTKLLEGFMQAEFTLASWMNLHIGWRYFAIDAKFDLNGPGEARVDFFYQGPYIGIQIKIG